MENAGKSAIVAAACFGLSVFAAVAQESSGITEPMPEVVANQWSPSVPALDPNFRGSTGGFQSWNTNGLRPNNSSSFREWFNDNHRRDWYGRRGGKYWHDRNGRDRRGKNRRR